MCAAAAAAAASCARGKGPGLKYPFSHMLHVVGPAAVIPKPAQQSHQQHMGIALAAEFCWDTEHHVWRVDCVMP